MFYKILFNLILLVSFLIIVYVVQTSKDSSDAIVYDRPRPQQTQIHVEEISTTLTNFSKVQSLSDITVVDQYFNVWCIFTKVKSKSATLKFKFHTLLNSILSHSSVNLTFHIISDERSQYYAENVFEEIKNSSRSLRAPQVIYYDVKNITTRLSAITSAMLPYFSSKPGAYYSDALFFISIGLHKVAPITQSRAVMIDVDTRFTDDIAFLFAEFNRFGERALVGLAPELSPVYQHVLYSYRTRHKGTRFGTPFSAGGFPGVNSGVLLLHLDRLRASDEYNEQLQPSAVAQLAKNYSFKGHLGDQDWYTLIGWDRPHLVHLLPCGWNRQLCDWWRYHGYRDTFDAFAQCTENVHLYHGNCDTPIPRSLCQLKQRIWANLIHVSTQRECGHLFSDVLPPTHKRTHKSMILDKEKKDCWKTMKLINLSRMIIETKAVMVLKMKMVA